MCSISTKLINLPTRDTVKLVIDDQFISSITEFSNYSWSLEKLQMVLTRLVGLCYTTGDSASAYNQVLLSESTKT